MSFENLENGEYLYKVEKSGYINHGYDSINITKDEIVYYELRKTSDREISYTNTKMSDKDSKEIFLPIIFLVLIVILVTGIMRIGK